MNKTSRVNGFKAIPTPQDFTSTGEGFTAKAMNITKGRDSFEYMLGTPLSGGWNDSKHDSS